MRCERSDQKVVLVSTRFPYNSTELVLSNNVHKDCQKIIAGEYCLAQRIQQ